MRSNGLLFVVAMVLVSGLNSVHGQEKDNPFDLVRPQDNPFDTPTEPQPLEIEKISDQNELQKRFAEAQYTIRNLKTEIAVIAQEKSRLEEFAAELQATNDAYEVLKSNLVNRLLMSSNGDEQVIAMEHLLEYVAAADDLGNPLSAPNESIVKRLISLLDAESSQVSELAKICLASYDPDEAEQQGFQDGVAYWLPADPRGLQIRKALNSSARMDYFETRLVDVIDELQAEYGIPITVNATEIDENTLITQTVAGISLREALSLALQQYDMRFEIAETLQIVPMDKPKQNKLLTYNVRGLLTDQLTMDTVIQLIEGLDSIQQTETVKIQPVDRHRLAVMAHESQHGEVSALLGSLGR